jgi:hypothetical protein
METDPYTKERETLLTHSTSQMQNHGWYLLTSIIAILTGMQASIQLEKLNKSVAVLVFSFVVGFGLAFLIHALGRILHYGRYCYYVIRINPEKPEYLKPEDNELKALDRAILNRLRNEHPYLEVFFSGDFGQLYFFISLAFAFSAYTFRLALIIFLQFYLALGEIIAYCIASILLIVAILLYAWINKRDPRQTKSNVRY